MVSAVSIYLGKRTEPFWFLVVGPPASAKTTMLNPIMACTDFVVARDDCTSNAMLSASDPTGARMRARAKGDDDEDYDPSLVKELDGKLFLIKDMTAILNRQKEADHFWSHMRLVYDGKLSKHSGTIGLQDTGPIRFGFLAATTDASIDLTLQKSSKLGDRFLLYRIHQQPTTIQEDRDMADKILASRKDQPEWEDRLAAVARTTLRRAVKQVKRVGVIDADKYQDPKIKTMVKDLASALAKIRTSPDEEVPVPHERNSRAVKQLSTFCDVSAICSGRKNWTQAEVELCRLLVKHSLPIRTRLILDFVAARSFSENPLDWATVAQITKAMGHRNEYFVRSQLNQWVFNKIMTVDDSSHYRILPKWLKHFVKCGVIVKPRTIPKRARITIDNRGASHVHNKARRGKKIRVSK